jgi:hypothetical protein
MIPLIYWAYYKPKMIKGSICCYIYRSKLNILPTTLSRTSRYATTIFRLPRCLYHMKYHLINRTNNFICKCNNIPIHADAVTESYRSVKKSANWKIYTITLEISMSVALSPCREANSY